MQESAYQRLDELEQEIAKRLIRVCQHMTTSDFAALVRRVALTRLKWVEYGPSFEFHVETVKLEPI
jgi:hypothetical protein